MFDKLFNHRKGVELPKIEQAPMALAPDLSPILQYVPPVILKTKKWVVHAGRVGIVADLSEFGFAEVHYVDDNGMTIEVNKKARVGELRLAKWAEIPLRRRPLDQRVAAGLGYY